MNEEQRHQELRPGDPGYDVYPVNQYEEMFKQAQDEASEAVPQKSRFGRLVDRMRKHRGDSIPLKVGDEIKTTQQDRESLTHLEKELAGRGLPDRFGVGIHIYPDDPSIGEEDRYMSLGYPVRRSDNSIDESGWETVIVNDHIEVWHPEDDNYDEPVVKKYTIGAWVDMQGAIDQQKKDEKEVQERLDAQLREIGEAVADDRYREHFDDIESDSEYKNKAKEAAESGDSSVLNDYVHKALIERQQQARYLPFVQEGEIGAKTAPVKRTPVTVNIDRIIGVHGWDDWRGRSGGRGGKSNDRDKVDYTTSGEHIVHLAEKKLNGTFMDERDRVELQEIYSNDGTYYLVTLGGHRVAAEKLLGGKSIVSADVTSSCVFKGKFGEQLKGLAKEKIAQRYIIETRAARA